MANVYFSSPTMRKNKKVVAVAGKRDALLGLALDNGVNIPYECKDGRCGSCLVEVTHLDGDHVKGATLTDKEREGLKNIGKLSAKEAEKANTYDLPPKNRLACQALVADEDILVKFTGEPGGA